MSEDGQKEEVNDEREIKKWLDAYDRVFDLYKLNVDDYLKHTQILMFAMQVAIFAAFGKLVLGGICKDALQLSLLLVIPLSGSLSAIAWLELIKRKWDAMEFYRCYMRYIERHLLELKVPLACFSAERAIFYLHRAVIFEESKSDSSSKSNRELQREFPYDGRKVKIGLMRIEKYIAIFLVGFWAACSITLLDYKLFENQLPWLCPIIFYAVIVLVFFIWRRKEQKKEETKAETISFWFLKDI